MEVGVFEGGGSINLAQNFRISDRMGRPLPTSLESKYVQNLSEIDQSPADSLASF